MLQPRQKQHSEEIPNPYSRRYPVLELQYDSIGLGLAELTAHSSQESIGCAQLREQRR
jgi:hypothetical protein